MISIIVPIYNAEQYLYRCIDSILHQNYTDFELLLIDDGSKDASGAICDEYAAKDTRVRVFHKENGGVSSARNLGLDNAQGEYITFCDADDYVDQEWLAAYRDAIAGDIDLAIQGYYVIDGCNTVEKKLQPYNGNTIEEKRQLITMLMCEETYGYLWVKLFRRALIENYKLKFDEQSAFREDEQFLSLYLQYAVSFTCIDSTGYYYTAPAQGKPYKNDKFYSIFLIFQSLDIIFNRELPKSILQRHYMNLENSAVLYLSEGKRLTLYHLDLYYRAIQALDDTQDLKRNIINHIILNSHRWGKLSNMIIRAIHKC